MPSNNGSNGDDPDENPIKEPAMNRDPTNQDPAQAQPLYRVTSDFIDKRVGPPPSPRRSSRDVVAGAGPPTAATPCSPRTTSQQEQLYYGNVFVQAGHGGQIVLNDPALVEWSVDAIALVRRQLFRAANGNIPLPFAEHLSLIHI